jgi:hypothetical protein
MFSFLRSCANAFTVQQNNNVTSPVQPTESNSSLHGSEQQEIKETEEHITTHIVSDESKSEVVEETIEENKEQAEFILLDESSERKKAPANAKITLLAHQEAMFQRCLNVEENKCKAKVIVKNEHRYMINPNTGKRFEIPEINDVNLGILNDKPGAGKTYVLLSLILENPGSSNHSNIICVPQNIFSQWKESFISYFPENIQTSLEVFYIDTYADVMRLYDLYDKKRPIEQTKPRLFLVNDGYIESFAQTINDNSVSIHRYIIDEIDSIQYRLFTPFYAEHVWLVSASFMFKGKNLVGPFKFNENEIGKIVCKCNEDFVSKHIKLPEPIVEQILCEDNEIQLIKDHVSSEVLQGLNTYDYRPFIKQMKKSFSPTKHTLFELIKMYSESIKVEECEIEEANNSDDPLKEFNVLRLKMQRENYLSLTKSIESFVESKLEETKDYKFKVNILERIKSEKEKKWLIFNDNSAALQEESEYLLSQGIKCIMLDGGNVKKVTKALHDYKNGDIQVLLLNSMLEGAGMNLENADYLLFMHKTSSRLVNQVVGRAQRFGRTTPLHILELFNKNELEIKFNDEDVQEAYKNQYVIDHKF